MPMQFFSDNPIGKIITRFTKDIAVLDFIIAPIVSEVLYGFIKSVGVIIAVMIVNPFTILVFVVVVILMIILLKKAMKSMLET